MVDFDTTLARLNNEKNYEDKLAEDLSFYLISRVDEIADLSDKERKILKDRLFEIKNDSMRHSFMFNQLMQMVVERGQANY